MERVATCSQHPPVRAVRGLVPGQSYKNTYPLPRATSCNGSRQLTREQRPSRPKKASADAESCHVDVKLLGLACILVVLL